MSDHFVSSMQDGDIKTIQRLVDSLDSVDEYVYYDDENCLTLLHLAVGLDCDHRDEIVELLLKNKANLNCPGRSENVDDVRPLHLASMWGYDITVKLLLYHGADASLRDSSGLSAIDYASIFDNYLCISLLLRYGSLNATATAWSAIMDNSLGESQLDTSLEELANDVLNLGGDDSRSSRRSKSEEKEKSFRPKRVPMDEDDEYDPLSLVKDEEVDYNIDNKQLRLELRCLGRSAGPITDTTKRLYVKLLAHLKREDKELVYSPRTKDKSKLNGYSIELNSILTGKFHTRQSLNLEKEFINISEQTKDYHGPKQFFNYILIDPRISRNLPEQAIDATSDSDTSRNNSSNGCNQSPSPDIQTPQRAMSKVNRKFNPDLFARFIESIFYIGKGQRKRDLMHLYDALADRGSITQKKIDRIRGIWDDGFGVVSLHLFHNITSKEALTREALMIETIGLNNLTNLLHGTLQFKLGWNEHKRKLLGSLMLHRAYTQFLNEGERQLKRDDLKK